MANGKGDIREKKEKRYISILFIIGQDKNYLIKIKNKGQIV